ncbi:MAG: hypothetical protein A2Y31_07785 [Spirochaetes bacterium GWC2_52_13]|nr:MAG: hypothetical protein A2Y31_07785 [Spirochaetes bacterium GWC2_52_13]
MPCRPRILAGFHTICAVKFWHRRGAYAVQLENLALRIGRKGVQVGNSLSFKCPADRISPMRRLHGIQIVYVPAILYDGIGWKILWEESRFFP